MAPGVSSLKPTGTSLNISYVLQIGSTSFFQMPCHTFKPALQVAGEIFVSRRSPKAAELTCKQGFPPMSTSVHRRRQD